MEITNVAAETVSVPVVPLDDGGLAPYVTNHGEVESMERVLVRVDTDEGISGWGEMRVFLSPRTTETILEDGIAPWVVGHSPFETESLRRQVFIEYTNVDMFFAPIEIACWDIVGKVLDKPIDELLGGRTAPGLTERTIDPNRQETSRVDVAYCLGILPPAESREHARHAHEQGYSVLKTKAGRDWREDVDRIVAMHDEVDGRLDFRLDPNQGWRFDEAVRVAAALEDAGVYLQYMEQPIRVDAHGTLARLRQRTSQPIGPNEDTYIAHNLRELIERDALDVAVLDMTPAGGIAAVRQLAGIAEDAGVPAAHHCAFDLGIRTAAVLHAVSGIPGFTLPPDTVYYAWEDDVLTERLAVEDGSIAVPDGPGLGVEIDPAKVEEYRVDHD
ncbi:mandelate racemase/muconate lactonizing enzyme family protein [Halococcus saccharolyticus]|uniref:glucarate dehydratase n=1 Tax=Halococcus saccharolyticus DSM 5350 TaxID=1227455 RepID=M0MHL2_9EURY|nr:mandelate racemase/muconate lactonizing enzyme family protein [Halococcus saccharolyticus]EMA44833.1 N-acylamino acid racemase [Halococcus saccharolyticus DSM 5350]